MRVRLLHPAAVVSEGIGELALEALLGAEAEQVAAECLRPLGIPYEPETAAAVRAAHEALLPVRANLALALDDGRIRTEEEAFDYARAWLLDDDAHVRQSVASLRQRRWPPYESCYPEGLALCRRFTSGDGARFRRLLREQLTPAALR